MKNVFLILAFILFGSFAFANDTVDTKVDSTEEVTTETPYQAASMDSDLPENEKMFDKSCAMGGSTGEEIICCSASTIEKADKCLERLLAMEVSLASE